jgi:hypothetical protein
MASAQAAAPEVDGILNVHCESGIPAMRGPPAEGEESRVLGRSDTSHAGAEARWRA